jgi:molybdopterin/thiamine biosynthesis adenylyltransferase
VKSKVLIIGLGGLGGYIVNGLVRLGVHNLTLVDFDSFDESNLNRQLFSKRNNIGHSKVDVTKKEIYLINPKCEVTSINKRIQDIEFEKFGNYDYIIDAVDNIESKIYISKLGTKLNIPVLHGACAGWYGQVGWMLPNCYLISDLYENKQFGMEKELSNPPFAPAFIGAVMVSEFLKMSLNSDTLVYNELILVDLYNNTIINTGRKDK